MQQQTGATNARRNTPPAGAMAFAAHAARAGKAGA
ncbi:MAG: hypothetical protein GAK33_02165 [Burkholderia lata]|uniref:Uncharacterized protein n=1 Tax=Burkholderia lata (strain ATCC 17760 / DSM 23089 / LMG 22485 / NCIMB 9086 / R18194 / 383) TaxID=482957 RepID=A0A833PYM6_BURL3|nr:MAG: hypothetical protein GAK33_02165 [Burkholderia lata]